ncbi:hypothetical protein N665_0339s0045 [Sinapis alba]|nr:hypothetical protein N665_0339s0045 [Sinapis alba]
MTVDFNGQIDGLYLNLKTKFEILKTHVKKLENQVMQISETIRRHESLIKEKIEAGQKHHVNALIDDNFWQKVKRERLQEGDFCVESFMSFGNSHWCRSTLSNEHRSTTPTAVLVASCESTNINRYRHKTIGRQRDSSIDRLCDLSIDRQRRRLDRLQSLNANLIMRPTMTASTHNNDTFEAMDFDREDEGHSKRKQKIPKHQRREANEKDEGHSKRKPMKKKWIASQK